MRKKGKILEGAIKTENEKITFFSFLSYIKAFLRDLLIDPINAKPNEFLVANGLKRGQLLNIMLDMGIVIREESVDDKVKPIFKIKYKVPRKNFERKLRRMFSRLFEKNYPPKPSLTEDGEGATSAACANDSAPIVPLGATVRRTIYVREEQLKRIREATATCSVGNYQYDVPFLGKSFGQCQYKKKRK